LIWRTKLLEHFPFITARKSEPGPIGGSGCESVPPRDRLTDAQVGESDSAPVAYSGGDTWIHILGDTLCDMGRWKIVLAWCCLFMFFGIPLIFFAAHLISMATGYPFFEHAKEFKYMENYLRTITAIIISLAGFNTVELFKK
jgi:hypothetical protein